MLKSNLYINRGTCPRHTSPRPCVAALPRAAKRAAKPPCEPRPADCPGPSHATAAKPRARGETACGKAASCHVKAAYNLVVII